MCRSFDGVSDETDFLRGSVAIVVLVFATAQVPVTICIVGLRLLLLGRVVQIVALV